MNGNTLKVVFRTVFFTLCGILSVMTFLVIIGKVTIEIYKDIITILGIPTLFGMVIQAFLRADADHDGVPDYQEEDERKKGDIK